MLRHESERDAFSFGGGSPKKRYLEGTQSVKEKDCLRLFLLPSVGLFRVLVGPVCYRIVIIERRPRIVVLRYQSNPRNTMRCGLRRGVIFR